MKLSDAKRLYELGGKPIDRLAALQLGYGPDWTKSLREPRLVHHLPDNKQLLAMVAAYGTTPPKVYWEARAWLFRRGEYSISKKLELEKRQSRTHLKVRFYLERPRLGKI